MTFATVKASLTCSYYINEKSFFILESFSVFVGFVYRDGV